MKNRRHHNNTGTRQVRRGKTRRQVAAMARRLQIPLAVGMTDAERQEIISQFVEAFNRSQR